MKEIIKRAYQCEKCGTFYHSADGALSCENSHHDLLEIAYVNYDSSSDKYPDYIEVRFSNGEKRAYQRYGSSK